MNLMLCIFLCNNEIKITEFELKKNKNNNIRLYEL